MSENQDRRTFLAGSAALAAVATLSPGGVFAAGNDTIKVGLVGCGGRGSGAIRDNLSADNRVKLVALGDVFKDRATRCLNGLKKDNHFKDKIDENVAIFDGLDAYHKVIEACDLVILATPPGFRPIHLEAAVKANKHIFTEKPVAVDGPGIRKVLSLVDESKKKNIAIVAGTQRRHQKGYIDTIKKIHDGGIGDIITGRCYWNGGGIWFNNREPNVSDAVYQIKNWYHFLWVCGDHIVEQHVHNLDVINWALQAVPIRAYGMGGRQGGGRHRPNGDPKVVGHIFDHFAVEYEYPNGVRVFSYCRHTPGTWDSVSEALHGSKGFSQVNQYTINNKPVAEDTNISPYRQEHIDLYQSIRASAPLNELKTVAESTMTAILGRMATYTGKPITWKQALESKEDTFPKELTLNSSLPEPVLPVPGKTKFI